MKALLRAGTISVQELAVQIGTPAASIRRDLARLEKRGLVLRTHGGATLVEPLLYEPFRYDTSFQARERRNAEQKRCIGLAAADLVSKNDVVGIMAGTTATQLGRALRHRHDLTVITNAINIGMELCNQPAIRTMLTGGTLAWAWTFALAGPTALSFLNTVFLDKAFISVTGFDLERGVTTLETEEAVLARTMAQQSREVVVVADSSKFGKVSPALVFPLSGVHTLVTDDAISAKMQKALDARGIRVVIA